MVESSKQNNRVEGGNSADHVNSLQNKHEG